MAVCKGCGVTIQHADPDQPGYSPKEGSDYCQRCFRLMHYDDLSISMRTGIDPDAVLAKIAGMDCLVLWVVDLFDFEAGMIPGLSRKLAGKDILMVAAKRDILPETLSHEKIARFVFGRLKEMGIKVQGLVLTGKLHSEGTEEVLEAVRMLVKGRPVVVMGRANAGKSTLLNSLMGHDTLTASRYPGTTLDFNPMKIGDFDFIDTPGIEIQNSLLMYVDEKDLKTILPSRTIKPQIFQISGNQSFTIGGLARLDLLGCDHAVCVWYLSDALPVHRSKAEGAEDLWQKHYGELFTPVPLSESFETTMVHKNLDRMDAVIDGLGWACISGQVSTIRCMAPKGVRVTYRKAML